jgi:hypothetical protein
VDLLRLVNADFDHVSMHGAPVRRQVVGGRIRTQSTIAMTAIPVKKSTRKNGKSSLIEGKPIALFSGGLALVDTAMKRPEDKKIRPAEQTQSLIHKIGLALEKPGISRKAIFPPGAKSHYAYSADPRDPSILVRRSADGTTQRGRLVRGKFRALITK